jgi:hypothetical protein
MAGKITPNKPVFLEDKNEVTCVTSFLLRENEGIKNQQITTQGCSAAMF